MDDQTQSAATGTPGRGVPPDVNVAPESGQTPLPAQKKPRRTKGETHGEHTVRTTRYYSISNDELANIGRNQTIATVCFSLGTGFFFTYLPSRQSGNSDTTSLLVSIAFYIAGGVVWKLTRSQIKSIKREHDYPEDKLTIPAKFGRWLRSFYD